MSEHDLSRYEEEPAALLDLLRDVIASLQEKADAPETAQKETQLREIARTIDRLEKTGVPVPESLRAEKTKLAAALSADNHGTAALNRLADGLEEILAELKADLGRDVPKAARKSGGGKRSRTPKTSAPELRACIIRALKMHGGSARVSEVIDAMGKMLEGKLLPGDLEWRDTAREYVWQNNAKWERNEMKKDGVLRDDSPHGVWELSEDYR